ncbi:ATP-dependent DNA helicase RecG [Ornithinicoccus halotolerans]|uniref:ATP-dependent DNA helicase RecG n=1 Tax=Ornithinicoccus halotolerans TaxID=1748220 RepID=UPI001E388ED1|nr:ATP-dependent DNA helicase RecG [Ornithinicoccus halotolerans]
MGLDTPLRSIVGRLASSFTAKQITTARELLDWLPRRYVDPKRPTDFTELAAGEQVVVVGTVRHAESRRMRGGRRSIFEAVLVDEAGHRLLLTFFRPYGHPGKLVPGARVVCAGKVDRYRQHWQLVHPEYHVLGGEGDDGPVGYGEGPVALYPEIPKVGHMKVAQAVDLVLHAMGDTVPDPVPEEVRQARDLPGLMTAYRFVHQPRDWAEKNLGWERLAWQEAFVIQATLARLRHSSEAVPAVPRPPREGGLAEAFHAQLPFALTDGQQRIVEEVRRDLARDRPMHRLLQGEVGSGKTVVALLAMLEVVDNGGQAALLAPTEVLAAQHHRSITAMLGPLAEAGMLGGADRGTRVALLTGSQGAAQRRAALLQAASGEAGIIVGTHALIQEQVQLADLGLVVVDEQHRFGVEQRDALRAKGADGTVPHVLVMTATPIPRTVAMTVYGDMEVSTLRELPGGRQPITTHVVTADRAHWVSRTWERVAEEVAAGGQVYVVCPRIGEEDDPDLPEGDTVGPGMPVPEPPEGQEGPTLLGVHQVARALRSLPATRALRIAAVHGRQPAEDKDAVMRDFAAGAVDVLVATTVIEVGVDVPNATQMVILDADRFGISQLHQLRGRVGRGSKPGLCLLLTQGTDEDAPERLRAVASTTDGFELARLDLEQRREGDVLGASQSGGRSGLRHLRLTNPRHAEFIAQAHEDAWAVVQADPDLEQHPALLDALSRLDAERAAYLERG